MYIHVCILWLMYGVLENFRNARSHIRIIEGFCRDFMFLFMRTPPKQVPPILGSPDIVISSESRRQPQNLEPSHVGLHLLSVSDSAGARKRD